MSQLRKWGLIALGLFFLSVAGLVRAQEATPEPTPRATPTNDPGVLQTPTDTPDRPSPTPQLTATATQIALATATPVDDQPQATDDQSKGTIQGMVYEDVDGDGNCVGTGAEREGPVPGVPIEFVSSDEETIITLTTGSDGRYALVAAGYSYWAVSARPGADWVVTSEPTLSVPIYEDSLVATDVNFCVQQASTATVLLPASGGRFGASFTGFLVVIGLSLILAGAFWSWRPQRQE